MSRLRELNDPRLWPLIGAAGDAAREAAIESLIVAAAPLVAAVLSRARRSETGMQAEDLEEAASHVNVRLVRKLRAAALFEEHAIASLDNYVAMLAYHAIHDLRRERFPQRHRLKKKLRHAFSRDPRLALWETLAGIAAGLAPWKGRTDVRARPEVDATPAMKDETRPADASVAILEQIGAPVGFDAFVNVVATLWNVHDAVAERDSFPPDARRDQLTELEQRQHMELLWSEITQLPENQRIALLLNLRDSAGANALVLFLLLQIATIEELAAGLNMTAEELSQLWEHLPLNDLAIAGRLNLSRQQVINLRRSARARLSRRMAVAQQ